MNISADIYLPLMKTHSARPLVGVKRSVHQSGLQDSPDRPQGPGRGTSGVFDLQPLTRLLESPPLSLCSIFPSFRLRLEPVLHDPAPRPVTPPPPHAEQTFTPTEMAEDADPY